MASLLSHPPSGSLPAGLRVLAVDHDLDSLDILEKMLLHCSYQVTTCRSADDALFLLRENHTRFDILITEIRLPMMSGFQLLAEALKLHMNLPVILFSDYLDHDKVEEGMYSGASYVLSKPISMDILKVVWQLAYRNAPRFDFGEVGSVDLAVPIKGSEEKLDSNPSCSSQEESGQINSNKKKPRFSWTGERHNLFLEALESLDNDKAVPSKIWTYMQKRRKDPYLTRHAISSHLQKFRGEKLEKQGESPASDAPYLRDTIQHALPLMYMTSHITPAVSSIRPTYLDRDTTFGECFQMNGYEPNPTGNLHRLHTPYELYNSNSQTYFW